MYWLSEYHAAKRTEYNETLSTELSSSRSTDYREVCTEYKVVSAEYLTIIPRVRIGYESIAYEPEGNFIYKAYFILTAPRNIVTKYLN